MPTSVQKHIRCSTYEILSRCNSGRWVFVSVPPSVSAASHLPLQIVTFKSGGYAPVTRQFSVVALRALGLRNNPPRTMSDSLLRKLLVATPSRSTSILFMPSTFTPGFLQLHTGWLKFKYSVSNIYTKVYSKCFHYLLNLFFNYILRIQRTNHKALTL
jgi:hypothetical protein